MLTQTTLWRRGEGGYPTYRFPALAITAAGTVLACCEGRRHSRHDYGNSDDTDIRARRSHDAGLGWLQFPLTLLAEGCPVRSVRVRAEAASKEGLFGQRSARLNVGGRLLLIEGIAVRGPQSWPFPLGEG